MPEKSDLERAIERQELVKKPISILILIAILCMGLGALGAYTFKLKQKIAVKEKEITLLNNSFNKERSSLLKKIKTLETEYGFNEPGTENILEAPRLNGDL